MSNEEAILHMILRREELKNSVGDLDEDIKAFDMAIRALEIIQTGLLKDCESYKALEQEPCDDAISRQAVLDHIYGINGLEGLELSNVFEKHYADFIKSLPSVSTEKTGHWIEDENEMLVRCSKCGEEHEECSKYCPNCGAKMEVEE